ncbi:MAG TPA: AAA family ATPase [Thermoanaerobaculia bacterium]|nr:AAA family ATPase [Thermoanaerobaculia bacterium]
MIDVRRPPAPSELQGLLDAATSRIVSSYTGSSMMAQKRAEPWSEPVWNHALPTLTVVFAAKCAYCESTAAGSDGLVDHFRPRSGAMDLAKRVDADHYHWLACEWTNLYLVCRTCNVNKKTKFPVDGARAPLGGSVADEKPELLDPCVDQPADHLVFEDTGHVIPASRRGEITIKVLGLDREDLVAARARVAAATLTALQSLPPLIDERILADLTRPDLEYAAVRRAAVKRWLDRPGAAGVTPEVKATVQAAAPQAAAAAAAAHQPDVSVRSSGFIKSIELKNFRAIQKLPPLPVAAAQDTGAGWLMLLGENASGKSSVLQAVALALLGEIQLAQLDVDLDPMINNDAKTATIRIHTTSDPPLIELRLRRGKKPEFVSGGEGYPGLVLGYGATRVVGGEVRHKHSYVSDDDKRVDNLFDPFAPLTPAEKWLQQLHDTDRAAFDGAATTLRDLLRVESTGPFVISENGRIVIDTGTGRVSIGQLSSGFQSVLTLAIDIMQASADQTHDKRYVSGIVLLDEIDAHLHPRWKMDVVEKLRTAFPYIQFMVSTHEPLCLRGMKAGEIVLMRRNEEGEIEAVSNLPSPERMRVDQLLTSSLFGLNTTLDPNIEIQFREYYAILAKPPEERAPDEQKRVLELKPRLGSYGVLGYTRRDQLVYECIDDYLAAEPRLTAGERARLKQSTKDKVLELWARVDAWAERDHS